jgi:hypothetical protein
MHGQFPLMLVVGVDTLKGVALGRSRGASSQTGPRCIGVGEDGVTASNKTGGMDNGLDDGTRGRCGVVSISMALESSLDSSTCATTGEMMAILAGKGFRIECNS